MAREELGGNQKRVYDYIVSETQRCGYPPSVREIGAALGLKSTSTVHGHLTRLEKKGYIRRDETKPRAIELLDREAKKPTVDLPLVGKVAAGTPITAVENIEEVYPFPEELVGAGEHFMLKVQGDSMIDAGILNGDMVVVRKQNSCENGEIVVAMVDDEATVKSFYREKGHIRLQPHNPTMEPIIVETCTVLGKVIALLRRF